MAFVRSKTIWWRITRCRKYQFFFNFQHRYFFNCYGGLWRQWINGSTALACVALVWRRCDLPNGWLRRNANKWHEQTNEETKRTDETNDMCAASRIMVCLRFPLQFSIRLKAKKKARTNASWTQLEHQHYAIAAHKKKKEYDVYIHSCIRYKCGWRSKTYMYKTNMPYMWTRSCETCVWYARSVVVVPIYQCSILKPTCLLSCRIYTDCITPSLQWILLIYDTTHNKFHTYIHTDMYRIR